MLKKFSLVIMCIIVLVSFVACNTDDTHKNDSTTKQTESHLTNDTSKEESGASETAPADSSTENTSDDSATASKETNSVFKTEDAVRITFYAYNGGGKGSDVSAENMTAITNWLDSFTIGEKAPEILPPGTNTYYVEIEYSDGTIIKNGLDTIKKDGVTYCLKSDKKPECFMEIISKASIK